MVAIYGTACGQKQKIKQRKSSNPVFRHKIALKSVKNSRLQRILFGVTGLEPAASWSRNSFFSDFHIMNFLKKRLTIIISNDIISKIYGTIAKW